MAEDTEDPPRDEPGEVAAAPAETPVESVPVVAAPSVNAGRALGFSRRGSRVPGGTTIAPPAASDEPQGTFQGSPYSAPPMPVSADRTARRAAARAALEQKAQEDWKTAYSNSQPVNPNGPRITPKQYRDAETAADRQASESASQASYSRRTKNSTSEAQMRSTGQRYYVDGGGNVQPMLEPKTGRPLFHGTPWEEGVDPKSGEPTLTKTDIYGQSQYKRPQMVAPADTSDNQLYYKMPDGTLTVAGDIDKLTKHQDPQVARTALRAVHARNTAMWKEAITPMEEAASQATAAHDVGLQQSLGLQAQIDQANEEMKSLDTNTMGQTQGAILGIGGKPTPAAVAETNKQNAILARIDALNKEKAGIDATTKAGGSLWETKRMAQLNLGLFKAKASHDNYLDLATERRLILKAQKKPEAGDPILASILQAQQTYGNAVTKFSGGIQQPVAPPRASHDLLVKSSGTRLDTGAAVPGKPGLFQSLPGPPHANDPVVDPDNPGAPTPSKFTMVGQSATSPAPAAPPAPPVPGAATPQQVPGAAGQQPAESPAGKSDPTLASEPFTLAARGVKNVGEVSMSEMARRYGNGQGAVQPASLVKIKSRLDGINATLNDPKTQIDGKVREGLQKEQEYLTSLSTQRFARLTPEQQASVTEATRDPTFWDKIKGAGKSLAQAAAEGGAGVMKGAALASNYVALDAASAGNVAGNLAAPETVKAQTEANPLYKMGSFIDEAAKESYAKGAHEDEGMVSQALNEIAKGAGGFAPLVASGPAAPLTVGLQTAGESMDRIYQEAVAKGAKPDVAAKMAVKRALLSGGVQSALFALLPKPLQKATSKLIVDKIAGNALTKFLANRLAQATEGGVLGGLSAAGSNVAEGRPTLEGVGGAAVGLGAIQAATGKSHPREKGPGVEAKAPEPMVDAPGRMVDAPPEPFKPTGAGQHSAAEAAKAFAPADADVRAAGDAASAAGPAAAEKVPPAKSAEESAMAFKAHEELNRRAAAKEESAQKLVDQIQESTGKSRGEILATRAGKDIDAWHDELKKEATYQKNPLVVDPERRATELRADLKRLDSEWQDHLTKTSQEAEIAAQADQTKKDAGEKFQAMKNDALARHEELTSRREAMESEITAAERLRQSPEGGEKLKGQLESEATTSADESRKLPTPELEGRRDAIEQQLTEAERVRQSPEGGAKLKEDLAAKEGAAPPDETAPKPKEEQAPKPAPEESPPKPAEPKEAAPKGKAAPEADERLGDQPVKLDMKRGATGEPVTVEMPAKKAAKRINDHLATLARVIDCLGGKSA